jgi:hypothetical protein
VYSFTTHSDLVFDQRSSLVDRCAVFVKKSSRNRHREAAMVKVMVADLVFFDRI